MITAYIIVAFLNLAYADTIVDPATVDPLTADKSMLLGTLEYPKSPSPKTTEKIKGKTFDVLKYQIPAQTSYTFSFEDMVWTALALQGETRCTDETHSSAVLWTLVQRGAINPKRAIRSPGGFTSMLKAYCQPINPKWASKTGYCKKKKNKDLCSADVVADRRKRIRLGKAIAAAGTWDVNSGSLKAKLKRAGISAGEMERLMPESCRKIAYKFVTGQLANPVPGAAEFASYCKVGKNNQFLSWFKLDNQIAHSRSRKVCPPKPRKDKRFHGGNLFYSDALIKKREKVKYSSHNWDGSEVTILGPTGKRSLVQSLIQPTDEQRRTKKIEIVTEDRSRIPSNKVFDFTLGTEVPSIMEDKKTQKSAE